MYDTFVQFPNGVLGINKKIDKVRSWGLRSTHIVAYKPDNPGFPENQFLLYDTKQFTSIKYLLPNIKDIGFVYDSEYELLC